MIRVSQADIESGLDLVLILHRAGSSIPILLPSAVIALHLEQAEFEKISDVSNTNWFTPEGLNPWQMFLR